MGFVDSSLYVLIPLWKGYNPVKILPNASAVPSAQEIDSSKIIPFFIKTHGHILREYFEPHLISKLQNEINKNNILIISFENNDKLLNLDNYSQPRKIDLNINSNKVKKFLYLYFPRKCQIV